jgi:hypothetical protein
MLLVLQPNLEKWSSDAVLLFLLMDGGGQRICRWMENEEGRLDIMDPNDGLTKVLCHWWEEYLSPEIMESWARVLDTWELGKGGDPIVPFALLTKDAERWTSIFDASLYTDLCDFFDMERERETYDREDYPDLVLERRVVVIEDPSSLAADAPLEFSRRPVEVQVLVFPMKKGDVFNDSCWAVCCLTNRGSVIFLEVVRPGASDFDFEALERTFRGSPASRCKQVPTLKGALEFIEQSLENIRVNSGFIHPVIKELPLPYRHVSSDDQD